MKKDILRRLAAVERRRAHDLEAMKKKAFHEFAPFVVVAYYLGNLKPNEPIFEAYARALNYDNLTELSRDFVRALETGGSEIKKRGQAAYGRLLRKYYPDCDHTTQTLEKAISELAEQLPAKWKRSIKKAVDSTNPYDEIKAEEVWSNVNRAWRKTIKRGAA